MLRCGWAGPAFPELETTEDNSHLMQKLPASSSTRCCWWLALSCQKSISTRSRVYRQPILHVAAVPCFWAALSQSCSKKLSTGTARTVHPPPDAAGFGPGGEELFGGPVTDLQQKRSVLGLLELEWCIRLLMQASALVVKSFSALLSQICSFFSVRDC